MTMRGNENSRLPSGDEVSERRRRRFERAELRRRRNKRIMAIIAIAAVILTSNSIVNKALVEAENGDDATDDFEPKAVAAKISETPPAPESNLVADEVTEDEVIEAAPEAAAQVEIHSRGTEEAVKYTTEYEALYGAPPSMDFGKNNKNVTIVKDYLEQTGQFSPEQICGILGNIAQESKFDPLSQNGHIAYGLFQWEDSRKANLMKHSDWQALSGQMDFFIHELDSDDARAAFKGLIKQETVEDAATVFCEKFERPSAPVLEKRIYYAEQFYLQYYSGKEVAKIIA
ncbi:MAG: phage tail-type lysozyme domain-containing protein [Candidatus Nomurabacteria bacterium]|nr:phage tail-type lysozyme domain-containing protein [Candidatus Nomurabacteria bacterium]